MTPFGMRAPTWINLDGSFKKSTISSSSSFSSCSPATSSKVTRFASGVIIRARLLPKFIILLLPPPACRFIIVKTKTSTIPIKSDGRIEIQTLLRSTSSISTSMLSCSRSSDSAFVISVTLTYFTLPSESSTFRLPVGTSWFGVISTFTTSSCVMASSNWS